MQNKRYNAVERQVLTLGGGINNQSISNEENTEVNFHGIRYKGRILIDTADGSFEFGSGWITLMCLPPGITTPVIDSSADANSFQQFIIATEQWSAMGGSPATDTANGNGAGAIYDFNITPKTSRNCVKDGSIVAQVINESIGIGAILTSVLSTFETTN